VAGVAGEAGNRSILSFAEREMGRPLPFVMPFVCVWVDTLVLIPGTLGAIFEEIRDCEV